MQIYKKVVNICTMDAILSKVKSKSKFLMALEAALKEDGITPTSSTTNSTTGAITTDPNSATTAATTAATAQQASGQQNAAAIKAANAALLAAVKAHPELNGDITKLSNPDFLKTLNTATTQ